MIMKINFKKGYKILRLQSHRSDDFGTLISKFTENILC